jgi:adenylate kinase
MKNFILILGPQGSGKSTQGKLLSEHLRYRFVSTGEILRQAADDKNPLGQKLVHYWEKGELVPDEIIEGILFPILENSVTTGFVLDGYPRTIEQVNSLVSFIELNGDSIKHVFYLSVGEEECIKRITERSQIEKRIDENAEAVKRRLAIYHAETEPLLSEYLRMGVLRKIDGEQSIEKIQKDIRGYF